MRFQDKVRVFTNDTFGSEIANNLTERCNRFAEESIELLQSAGYSKEKMLDMLDYVYRRESGKQAQEVGGVMVTLAALCNVIGVDMIKVAGKEIIRAIRNSQFIRLKHNGKPAGLAMHEENIFSSVISRIGRENSIV